MRDENEIETEMYIIVCDQMSYLFIALYDKNQWFFRLFFFFFFLWCLCVVFVVLTLNVPVPVPVCVCFGVVSLCRRSNPLYINWFSFSVFFINITLCACVCVCASLSVRLYLNGSMFIQFRSFAVRLPRITHLISSVSLFHTLFSSHQQTNHNITPPVHSFGIFKLDTFKFTILAHTHTHVIQSITE